MSNPLFPFACETHPLWISLAEEIHAAVWDRVGLLKVQVIIRQWADEWKRQQGELHARTLSDWKQGRDEAEEIERELTADIDRQLSNSRLPPSILADLTKRRESLIAERRRTPFPYSPPDPPLPLPPEDNKVYSLPEKWAGLAAIHDVYWRGEKISPWPIPLDDRDIEACANWLKEPFDGLMRKAYSLNEEDKNNGVQGAVNACGPVLKRWLADVLSETKKAPPAAPGKPDEDPAGDAGAVSTKLTVEDNNKVKVLTNAKLSPCELANKHGVNVGALRKRLERWRFGHDSGYIEVSNPAKNEPKYLFDESAVMSVINNLKTKSAGQERPTNVQQKNI